MSTLLLALWLSIPVNVDGATSASFHRPSGTGPFPAVLMIEGWWTAGTWDAAAADCLAACHAFLKARLER